MSQRSKAKRAPTPPLPSTFGRPYVEAVYGIAPRSEPRKAVHAKKPNPLDPVSYTHLTLPTICSV